MRWLASNPIKLFTWVSLFFGLAFTLLIPPFQAPDEFTHFTRAYEVSSWQTGHRHHEKKLDLEGSYLPKSILLTYDKTRLFQTPNSLDVPQAKKYFLDQTRDSFKIPLNKHVKRFYDTGATPAYVPLLYIPQAVTIKLLGMVGTPIILMLYATRLVCLAIWLSLGVIALKRITSARLRLALASVMLLPMFVSQAAIPGTDALLTGATSVFFVVMFDLYQNRSPLTIRQNILLTSLLLLMVAAKPVYLVFGLLMLPLKSPYGKVPNLINALSGTILVGILYVTWSYVTRYQGGPVYINSIDAAHAAPHAQLHYLVPHVFNFFEPLINTLFLGWGDAIIVSLGGVFGRLDTPLPLLFIVISYGLMLIAIFSEDETADHVRSPQGRRTLLVACAAVLYTTGVLLSMYIISTPPHEKVILGVQGRYFLPVVLMLTVFMPKFIRVKKSALTLIYTVTPLVLLSASITVVWLRYYLMYPR